MFNLGMSRKVSVVKFIVMVRMIICVCRVLCKSLLYIVWMVLNVRLKNCVNGYNVRLYILFNIC